MSIDIDSRGRIRGSGSGILHSAPKNVSISMKKVVLRGRGDYSLTRTEEVVFEVNDVWMGN